MMTPVKLPKIFLTIGLSTALLANAADRTAGNRGVTAQGDR